MVKDDPQPGMDPFTDEEKIARDAAVPENVAFRLEIERRPDLDREDSSGYIVSAINHSRGSSELEMVLDTMLETVARIKRQLTVLAIRDFLQSVKDAGMDLPESAESDIEELAEQVGVMFVGVSSTDDESGQ